MNLKNLTIRILYFKTVVPDCGSRVGLRSVLLTHKKKLYSQLLLLIVGSVNNFLHFCVIFLLLFSNGHYDSHGHFIHVAFVASLVF